MMSIGKLKNQMVSHLACSLVTGLTVFVINIQQDDTNNNLCQANVTEVPNNVS